MDDYGQRTYVRQSLHESTESQKLHVKYVYISTYNNAIDRAEIVSST